jgi:hypothetical protein
MFPLTVSEGPINIRVWRDSDVSADRSDLKVLTDRIEKLEQLVTQLLHQKQGDSYSIVSTEAIKPKKSPFFSSSVPEPVGLEIDSNFALHSEENSVSDNETFKQLIKGTNEKRVTLNGITFIVRNWGTDVVYCEEATGRTFLDPSDAFKDPKGTYVGYWNAEKDEVSVRSDDEDFDNEIEEVVTIKLEPKKEVVIVKEEPKVVVKEEPKVVIKEEPKVVVKEEPKVVVKEEPKKQETPPESDTEVEAEEEEEESDLVEFEYKGVTYYRDSENQVYELNEEGELNEDPVGVWNEQKQKVQKYPKQ